MVCRALPSHVLFWGFFAGSGEDDELKDGRPLLPAHSLFDACAVCFRVSLMGDHPGYQCDQVPGSHDAREPILINVVPINTSLINPYHVSIVEHSETCLDDGARGRHLRAPWQIQVNVNFKLTVQLLAI